MQPLIEVEDLSFGYTPDYETLKNVSFEVFKGDFIGLIGPNGGGKTTLLKLILGFLKPKSGVIRIFGMPPGSSTTKVGYVPQAMRFDKQFPISVLEVVLLGRLATLPWYGKFQATDKQAAMRALECVGLAEYKNKAFGTLSGGQAQRVLLARALASDPELLLLDEPTASIDAEAQTEIYSLLKKLAGTITILMVTHDLDVAIKSVNRVLCIQQTAFALEPQEVCQHFAFGLYHPTLLTKPSEKS